MSSVIEKPGCHRMIFIKSGTYDYAEIDLRDPLHLVGANNVGKTSFIAALQFLFIGEFNQTRFGGHSLPDTYRYYFRESGSFILFECLSAETQGMVTIGLRGEGPAAGYRPTRFAFSGGYDRALFLRNENGGEQVRDPDDVEMQINRHRRAYRKVEPKDIHAILTGTSEFEALNLGIVPLLREASHRTFTSLFRNLLNLSKMEQEEIKSVLITICAAEIETEVDFRRVHAGQYETLERQRIELTRLDSLGPYLDEMRDDKKKLGRSRAELAAMHPVLLDLHEVEIGRISAKLEEESNQLAALQQTQSSLISDGQSISLKIGELQGGINAQEVRINEHTTAASKFANFVKEQEQQILAQIQHETANLQGKLAHGKRDTPESAGAILSKKKAEMTRKATNLEKFNSLFSRVLTDKFGENQVKEVFRILNPAILEIDTGQDGVKVVNEDALRKALNHLDSLVDSSAQLVRGHGVELPITSLKAAALPDREQLAEEVKALAEEVADWESRLLVSQQRSLMESRLQELQAIREEVMRKVIDYDSLQKEASELPSRRLVIDQNKQAIEEWTRKCDANKDQIDGFTATIRELTGRESSTDEKLRRVRNYGIPRPDPEWIPAMDTKMESGYEGLMAQYQTMFGLANDLVSNIARAAERMEKGLLQDFEGATVEERINAAFEEYESRDMKLANFNDSLEFITASVKHGVRSMVQSTQTLKARVNEISRDFRQIQISNLRRVSISLKETDRWKTYASLNEDLFNSSKAEEVIRKVIKGEDGLNGKITIDELFGIEFEVEQADGTKRKFSNLDTIESNGTTIMIKALVNMMMMKGLMRKSRATSLPFYLDEVNQIDTPNLEGLVKTSLSLGFVPILASTSPMTVAKIIYSVRSINGRTVIDERRKMVIVPDQEPELA